VYEENMTMLKIHDLAETQELDRDAMQAVEGGVDYKAASKNSGYREVQSADPELYMKTIGLWFAL